MPARTDAENLKRLEEARPQFERLTAERIRAESDIERLTAELEEARAQARALLGTDDEAEIGAIIEAARAENTRLVDDFAGLVAAIDARLKALAEGAA